MVIRKWRITFVNNGPFWSLVYSPSTYRNVAIGFCPVFRFGWSRAAYSRWITVGPFVAILTDITKP